MKFFPWKNRQKRSLPSLFLAAAAGVIAGNLFVISVLPGYLWGGFFQNITGLLPVAGGLLSGLVTGVFSSSTPKALKITFFSLFLAGILCLLVILLPAFCGLVRETGWLQLLAVQKSVVCVLLSIPGSVVGCLAGRYLTR